MHKATKHDTTTCCGVVTCTSCATFQLDVNSQHNSSLIHTSLGYYILLTLQPCSYNYDNPRLSTWPISNKQLEQEKNNHTSQLQLTPCNSTTYMQDVGIVPQDVGIVQKYSGWCCSYSCFFRVESVYMHLFLLCCTCIVSFLCTSLALENSCAHLHNCTAHAFCCFHIGKKIMIIIHMQGRLIMYAYVV